MILNELRVGLDKKFYDLCKGVVGKEGLALYDLEYYPGQGLLRIYIFNEETKTALLEDCVRIDRALSPYIEKEEWVPEALTLEVSSPGIYRSLKIKDHFLRAIDQWVSLVVSSQFNSDSLKDLPSKYRGQKKFRGILKEVSEDSIVLGLENCQLKLHYDAIKKANLDPEWS